jgi:Holliday junction resolvase RusA-like endonuclease
VAVTVLIPGTPPRALSANGRSHWRAKAEHVRAYRETARLAALAAGAEPVAGSVRLRLTYGWERGRKRVDFDNGVALAKAAIDGIVDAGVMGDDRYVVAVELAQERDPEGRGYLIVEVETA